MEAWTTIAHRLADTPGRKNLIWLSGGFPLCIPSRSVQGTTDCFDAEVENAARSLNDARVAVYPVDARALLPRRGPLGLSVFDTFNRIARLTGGAAFYNTNGVKEAIREAMDDSGAVYTLGFYVTDAEMDGAFHPLKVNVSAKDVELRYRSGYFATKDSTLTPEQRFASLTDAIYGPLLPAGVRLQATAAADPDRPGAYRVEVSINANDLHWDRLEHVWRAEFASASIWEPDAPSQVATEPVEVHLTDDRFHEVAKTGLVWTTSVSPGAKAKSLRIVIQDQATGLVGAALVPLKQK